MGKLDKWVAGRDMPENPDSLEAVDSPGEVGSLVEDTGSSAALDTVAEDKWAGVDSFVAERNLEEDILGLVDKPGEPNSPVRAD